MRGRLIRRVVAASAFAALLATSGAAAAAPRISLTGLSGLPRALVQPSALSLSLSVRNRGGQEARPTLSAWLSHGKTLSRLRLTPSHPPIPGGKHTILPLLAAVPTNLSDGTYSVIVCASPRRLQKPPARGCIRSHTFSLIAAVRIRTGLVGPTVKPTLDLSRASSATIGSAGGTLSSTAADGSKLTLTIPQNALAGDEQVTIIPLEKLDQAGVTLTAGAQVAPDGLRLLAPATLDVSPARSVTLSRQVAFGYRSNGTQFGLLPLAPKRGIEIPLLRLGGAGLASASSSELGSREARAPSEPEGAWLQQLAAPLYKLRLARLRRRAAGSPDPAREAKGELGGYYNQYVEPALRGGGSSLGAWVRAASRVIGWEQELQLLGYSRLFSSQQRQPADEAFARALSQIWSKRVAMCAGGGSVGHLQAVLSLGRTAELVDLDSVLGGTAAIEGTIQSCSQMTVQAAVHVRNQTWQAASARSRVFSDAATVDASGPLQLVQRQGDDSFVFESGHMPVSEQVTSVTASPTDLANGCTQPVLVGFSSDLNLMYAQFAGKLMLPADVFDSSPPPWTFDLTVTGADMASWTITCPPGITPTPFNQAPGSMAGLGAITTTSPVRLTATNPSRPFTGSSDIIVGQAIDGFGGAGGGRASVSVPG